MKDTVRIVDYEKLYALLSKAKGDKRSFRQYAIDGGFSHSLPTRIFRKEFVPGFLTLFHFTSTEAKPENGVTFTDLMKASGYPDLDYEPLAKELEKLKGALE